MKRSTRLALSLTLLIAGAALAGVTWDEGPGHYPLREIPRLWVKGLRPHPQSSRSVAPATAPATSADPGPFTVSLDLEGLHVGLPAEVSGPAVGLTWDGELRPWARLD